MVGFEIVVFFPSIYPQNRPNFQGNKKHIYNQLNITSHHTHKLLSLEVHLI